MQLKENDQGKHNYARFGGQIGFVLASAGCAVGLGNL